MQLNENICNNQTSSHSNFNYFSSGHAHAYDVFLDGDAGFKIAF